MKQYIAIDLKSFYAFAVCVGRGRDPLTTNLFVAEPTRIEKTIGFTKPDSSPTGNPAASMCR